MADVRVACVRFVYQAKPRHIPGGQCAASRAASFIDRLRQLPAEPDQIGNRDARRPARKQCEPSAIEARWHYAIGAMSDAVMARNGGLKSTLPVRLRFTRAPCGGRRATAVARNSQAPMRNMATRFRPAGSPDFQSAILDGNHSTSSADAKRLALVQNLCGWRRRDRSRLAARPSGRMRKIAVTAAHWRMGDGARSTAGQSVDRRDCPQAK